MNSADYAKAFRFGFGVNAARAFDPHAEMSIPPMDDPASGVEVKRRLQWLTDYQQHAKADGRSEEKQKARMAFLRELELRDVHRAIMGAASSDRMFTHRISAFWANHFSLGKTGPVLRAVSGLYEQHALRPHIFGSFAELLISAELHPAMIHYLDLQQSIGPNSKAGQKRGKGFNENLGREILELHTLGADGGYAQADVAALSKLLTGWHVRGETAEVTFTKGRAEPGQKLLLETRFGGDAPKDQDAKEALRFIAQHPSTARNIARKLSFHFFGPGHDDLSKAMENAFMSSKGNLAQVYDVMLSHSSAAAHPSTQARNDYVFLVSALRAGTLRAKSLEDRPLKEGRVPPHPLTSGAMNNLTQKLWLAPSPRGWPDDPAYWISPTVIGARLRRIPVIVRNFADEDPMTFADHALGPLMTANTRTTLKAASNRMQAMGLALASPEFNRR
jgi:uncharacterized protein (DUF1800 family)